MGITKHRKRKEKLMENLLSMFLVAITLISFILAILPIIFPKKASGFMNVLAVLFCIYAIIALLIGKKPYIAFAFLMLLCINAYLISNKSDKSNKD